MQFQRREFSARKLKNTILVEKGVHSPKKTENWKIEKQKANSTLRASRAVPHPSTDRALRRLTSEVRRDPVHSTRYGRWRRMKQANFQIRQKRKYNPNISVKKQIFAFCGPGERHHSVHFITHQSFAFY